MPKSRCIACISSRICAWMVTSSAVVGSSAIRSVGLLASAIAIIARWRMPPRELVRILVDARARRLGMPDPAQQLDSPAPAPPSCSCRGGRCSGSTPGRRSCSTGFRRGHRVLEDHRDVLAAHVSAAASRSSGQVPRRRRRPAASPRRRRSCRADSGISPRIESDSTVLPRSRLADDAQRLAGIDSKETSLTAFTWPPGW